jgi:hypothetical protein
MIFCSILIFYFNFIVLLRWVLVFLDLPFLVYSFLFYFCLGCIFDVLAFVSLHPTIHGKVLKVPHSEPVRRS